MYSFLCNEISYFSKYEYTYIFYTYRLNSQRYILEFDFLLIDIPSQNLTKLTSNILKHRYSEVCYDDGHSPEMIFKTDGLSAEKSYHVAIKTTFHLVTSEMSDAITVKTEGKTNVSLSHKCIPLSKMLSILFIKFAIMKFQRLTSRSFLFYLSNNHVVHHIFTKYI